ncbi:MAG: hypothetical protein KDE08_10840 [Rhodobacteraceae bacterium]|nr:hypothetical protein [Paracoccaceae bacterium]
MTRITILRRLRLPFIAHRHASSHHPDVRAYGDVFLSDYLLRDIGLLDDSGHRRSN